MKKKLISSAIIISALAASAFTGNPTTEKSYHFNAQLNAWGDVFSTLDSATKYVGVKSIGFEDAVVLKQKLQALKQDMYSQLKPQIDADSNYYKQQVKDSTKQK